MPTLLSIGLSVALVCAVTFGLMHCSRKYPPALSSVQHKTGIGGVMLLFIAGEVAIMLRLLVQCTYLYANLKAISASFIDGLVIMAPTATAVILGALVLFELVVSRRASAPATAIVALWVKGPVFVPLQAWFFSQPVAMMTLVEIVGWAFVWTVYLVLSSRVALTYATKRGYRLCQRKF